MARHILACEEYCGRKGLKGSKVNFACGNLCWCHQSEARER